MNVEVIDLVYNTAPDMAEFFLVDRFGGCKTGVDLYFQSPFYAVDHHTMPGLQTAAEIAETLTAMFPEGLSLHGQRYLLEPHVMPQGGYSVNHLIELVFELVRRARFPTKPTRFQSFFGCETVEQARIFRQRFCQPFHCIYRVHADDFCRCDMELLKLGVSGSSALNLVGKYWSGSASPNPFWEERPPVRVAERVDPA